MEDKLAAALGAIAQLNVRAKEKAWLRREVLVAAVGEDTGSSSQAEGHTTDEVMGAREQLLSAASKICGRKFHIGNLQSTLRHAGHHSLAKRVASLNRGRRVLAHPDTELLADVVEA